MDANDMLALGLVIGTMEAGRSAMLPRLEMNRQSHHPYAKPVHGRIERICEGRLAFGRADGTRTVRRCRSIARQGYCFP